MSQIAARFRMGFYTADGGQRGHKKPWNGGRSEPEIVCLAVFLSRQRVIPTVCVWQIMFPLLFAETGSNNLILTGDVA